MDIAQQDTVSKKYEVFKHYMHHADGTLISGNKEIYINLYDAKTDIIYRQLIADSNGMSYLSIMEEIPEEIKQPIIYVDLLEFNDKNEVVAKSFFNYNFPSLLLTNSQTDKLIINPSKISENEPDYIITNSIEKKFYTNGEISRLEEKEFDDKENLLNLTVSNYDDGGRIISQNKSGPTGEFISKREFQYIDFHGKETEPSDTYSNRVENIYNEYSQIIERKAIDFNGDIRSHSTYKYEEHDNGGIRTYLQYEFNGSDNKLLGCKTSYINSQGQLFSIIETSGVDKELYSKTLFKYDSDGNLTERSLEKYNDYGKTRVRIITDGNDEIISKTEYLYNYNHNGKIGRIKTTGKNDIPMSTTTYLYGTDGISGKVTYETYQYFDDYDYYEEKTTTLSDEFISRKETIEKFNQDDRLFEETNNEYDNHNNLVSVEVTDGALEFLSKSIYEYNYDSQGQWSIRTESVYNSEDEIVDTIMTNDKGEKMSVLPPSISKENDDISIDVLASAASSFPPDTAVPSGIQIDYRYIQSNNNVLAPHQHAA